MDEKRLAEIEERAAKATPGPWLITLPEDGVGYTHGAIIWGEASPADKPYWVEDGVNIGEMAPTDDDYGPDGLNQNSNGEFVRHARADIPDLLAEVKRLREALRDIAHGPVGYWNEPQYREQVIGHLMKIATEALNDPL